LPYKDKEKQRKAVNAAVKRHYLRMKEAQKANKPAFPRKVGRPLGSRTYDTPEMIQLAIARQERRLADLLNKRDLYDYTSREYRNMGSYVSETRNRIDKLQGQLESLLESSSKKLSLSNGSRQVAT
jgi:hypothetical protein